MPSLKTLLPLNSLFTFICPTSEPTGWLLLCPSAMTQFCHYLWDYKLKLCLRHWEATELILVSYKYSGRYLKYRGSSEKTSCHQVHVSSHPFARHTKMFRLLYWHCLLKYSQSCIFLGHLAYFLILQKFPVKLIFICRQTGKCEGHQTQSVICTGTNLCEQGCCS